MEHLLTFMSILEFFFKICWKINYLEQNMNETGWGIFSVPNFLLEGFQDFFGTKFSAKLLPRLFCYLIFSEAGFWTFYVLWNLSDLVRSQWILCYFKYKLYYNQSVLCTSRLQHRLFCILIFNKFCLNNNQGQVGSPWNLFSELIVNLLHFGKVAKNNQFSK